MQSSETKHPSDSAVETRYLLMPNHANPHGTAFGGVILSWIDMAASMAAQRHSRRTCLTAAIDSVSFRHPIYIGDHVVLRAMVNYTGRTSMEVGVQVTREDPLTGGAVKTTTAYVTLVAVDENLKPVPVPKVVPITEEEKRRWHAASVRAENRGRLRQSRTE